MHILRAIVITILYKAIVWMSLLLHVYNNRERLINALIGVCANSTHIDYICFDRNRLRVHGLK